VLPRAYLAQARALCDRRGLKLHLDGARLYNAAVADGVAPREIAQHFDSVSVCLSKGLGAPVGSVLVGSRALIDDAKRWRKVAGGGWRQAGMLAAACLHALDHHVERLADDHRRAKTLADGLQGLKHVTVAGQHTNMVFIDVPKDKLDAFRKHMDNAGIRMSIGYLPRIRMVTHLDVDDDGIARAIAAFRSFEG
jgi:threonine aldolase